MVKKLKTRQLFFFHEKLTFWEKTLAFFVGHQEYVAVTRCPSVNQSCFCFTQPTALTLLRPTAVQYVT